MKSNSCAKAGCLGGTFQRWSRICARWHVGVPWSALADAADTHFLKAKATSQSSPYKHQGGLMGKGGQTPKWGKCRWRASLWLTVQTCNQKEWFDTPNCLKRCLAQNSQVVCKFLHELSHKPAILKSIAHKTLGEVKWSLFLFTPKQNVPLVRKPLHRYF